MSCISPIAPAGDTARSPDPSTVSRAPMTTGSMPATCALDWSGSQYWNARPHEPIPENAEYRLVIEPGAYAAMTSGWSPEPRSGGPLDPDGSEEAVAVGRTLVAATCTTSGV